MTFVNIAGLVLMAVIVSAGIGLRLYTRRKIKDLEGFCGIIKP